MKALSNSKALPLNGYGAVELKLFSPKATTRGFLVTILMISIILLLIQFLNKEIAIDQTFDTPVTPPTVITKFDFDLPKIEQKSSSIIGVESPVTGTKNISGDFKAVSDDNISIDNTKNIATFENQGTVSSKIGVAENIVETIKKDVENEPVKAITAPIEVEDDIFIPVDKDPVADLGKLSKSIVYPYLAKQAGVEGKVLVRAYIGTDGKVIKTKIDYSENSLFDDAAINAVKTPGIFQPAIQDNRPVACWITIPILFRIR